MLNPSLKRLIITILFCASIYHTHIETNMSSLISDGSLSFCWSDESYIHTSAVRRSWSEVLLRAQIAWYATRTRRSQHHCRPIPTAQAPKQVTFEKVHTILYGDPHTMFIYHHAHKHFRKILDHSDIYTSLQADTFTAVIHKLYPRRGLRSLDMAVTCRTRKNYGRKRPYFSMLYETVLRPCISVIVYGQIRWDTEKNGGKRRPCTLSVYLERKWPFSSPFIAVFLHKRHGDARS